MGKNRMRWRRAVSVREVQQMKEKKRRKREGWIQKHQDNESQAAKEAKKNE